MLCAMNAPSLRNETGTFTSNGEPRKAVLWKTTVMTARSVSPKGTLRMRTGRTFSTMPQSNNQISPRLGGTLLLIEQGSNLVAGGGGCVVVQRAGIPGRQ